MKHSSKNNYFGKNSKQNKKNLDSNFYSKNKDSSQKNNKLTLREEVYNLLLERLYSTEQIADALGQPLSSICARINELKKIDLVIDSGQRTKSKYGRDCVLWQRKDQIKQRENI